MILNNAENMMLGNRIISKVYLGDNEVWLRAGVHEKVARPPFSFLSNGSNLLDWYIKGAAGGVGDRGINYLKQEPVSVNNGHAGDPYNGDVVTTFNSDNNPYIPDNTYPSQWLKTNCTMTIGVPGGLTVGVDDRNPVYSQSQYKLTLSAGSYKFIFEGFDGAKEWKSDFLSRFSSAYGYQGNVFFALLDESNNRIAYQELDRTQYSNDNFLHFEYPFTLSEETNLAVMFLSARFNLRFMIVDSDVVAEPFEVQYGIYTITGNTCWQPYNITIPVTVSSGGQSQTVEVIVDAPLEANDYITKTQAGVNIPTYDGTNTITVGTIVNPTEMYIKYTI